MYNLKEVRVNECQTTKGRDFLKSSNEMEVAIKLIERDMEKYRLMCREADMYIDKTRCYTLNRVFCALSRLRDELRELNKEPRHEYPALNHLNN